MLDLDLFFLLMFYVEHCVTQCLMVVHSSKFFWLWMAYLQQLGIINKKAVYCQCAMNALWAYVPVSRLVLGNHPADVIAHTAYAYHALPLQGDNRRLHFSTHKKHNIYLSLLSVSSLYLYGRFWETLGDFGRMLITCEHSTRQCC